MKSVKKDTTHYSIRQLPIIPLLLAREIYEKFRKKDSKSAIGLVSAALILLPLWIWGYYLAGLVIYRIINVFILKNTSPQTVYVLPTEKPTIIPTPTPKPYVIDDGKLFYEVNDYRSEMGLNILSWYHPLCEYSKERSQEVATDWSHEGYEQNSASGVLYETLCPECAATGENLAKGYATEEAIVKAWIESPGHKENLDGNWNWGCAIVYSNNYVSFIFGKSY